MIVNKMLSSQEVTKNGVARCLLNVSAIVRPETFLPLLSPEHSPGVKTAIWPVMPMLDAGSLTEDLSTFGSL